MFDLAKRKIINIQCDHSKATPLHFAAMHGALYACEWLLSAQADTNAVDVHGATPLHAAAYRQDWKSCETAMKICKMLLDYGADINLSTNAEQTPLEVAEHSHYDGLPAFLILRGAFPIKKKEKRKSRRLSTSDANRLKGGEESSSRRRGLSARSLRAHWDRTKTN